MEPRLTKRLLNANVTELKFQVGPEIPLKCSSGRDSKESQRTQAYKLLFSKPTRTI